MFEGNVRLRSRKKLAGKNIVSFIDNVNPHPATMRAYKTAKEISEKVHLSEDRLLQLADSGVIPHYRVDGQPFFVMTSVKQWIEENLVQTINGYSLPLDIRPIFITERARDVPPQLQAMGRLIDIPAVFYPTGVYFLCLKDEIVYIGQAVSPASRISQHHDTGKVFDRAFLIPVPRDELNQVEGAFIRLFKPKLNGGKNRLKSPELLGALGNPFLDKTVLETYQSSHKSS